MVGKIYIPGELKKAGLPPVFDSRDIIYMRYRDSVTESVVRVARFDPAQGIVQALYPTDDVDRFSGESFTSVEQESARVSVEKSVLQDKIWAALLEGQDARRILKEHRPQMLGAYPSGSYLFSTDPNSRTFHIVDTVEVMPEPVST